METANQSQQVLWRTQTVCVCPTDDVDNDHDDKRVTPNVRVFVHVGSLAQLQLSKHYSEL